MLWNRSHNCILWYKSGYFMKINEKSIIVLLLCSVLLFARKHEMEFRKTLYFHFPRFTRNWQRTLLMQNPCSNKHIFDPLESIKLEFWRNPHFFKANVLIFITILFDAYEYRTIWYIFVASWSYGHILRFNVMTSRNLRYT